MKLISIRTIVLSAAAAVMSGAASAHPGHDHSHANHNILEMPPLDAGQAAQVGIALILVGLAIFGIVLGHTSRDK